MADVLRKVAGSERILGMEPYKRRCEMISVLPSSNPNPIGRRRSSHTISSDIIWDYPHVTLKRLDVGTIDMDKK